MKQINFFVIISCIFISATHCKSSRSTQKDCLQFRTGKFYAFSKETNEKYYITRTDSIQIETIPSTGFSSTNKITWKNDCEYQLLALTNTNPVQDSVDLYLKAIPIKVKIIKSTSDYYVIMAQINSSIKKFTFMDTIFIAK